MSILNFFEISQYPKGIEQIDINEKYHFQ